ncbi:tRNA cyclic N6-threonylcarbamoyladenosine(37) synthase TcdA [Ketobacter sp. MCCC 1A13808]|uniref:tRNA cyclic N6-threonylcarbamoyladenosine(37) synthase TcdA n=1 Tax=Ketobacter sp. MCCC 1A13808 TaxID=2602738 RepID=UPI000F183AF7|nr:tRNA cyclic N6-threonylcarbamoyladenosine(37) synthase TcdA [Ketobacter sp. MCCC 1A13808]MVF10841.1 tRNA cyclic N6-threonylcarbamoyladenosine(37) synthase TcdA [Ketobacter sp. MCCC 1A13808]RLP56240.1 MAG: tRNA cyclic N6-threonylcarbamoyladenosine(37) synthase TcdA [Ketobacter sp.]
MPSQEYLNRFAGIERLYGAGTLEILQHTHICVVGIGGVGSWAAEALARSGIGEITLMDLDDICISNTNRQIHATADNYGQLKVDAMVRRLLSINPELKCHGDADFVTAGNVSEKLTPRFHYVLDATDAVKHKVAMIVHCKRNKIPVYVVGGAGGQIDPTRIRYADLTRAEQDPLLALVRKKLRQDHGYSSNLKRRFSIECVYSDEPLMFPQADGSVCSSRPQRQETNSLRLDCSGGIGASTCVTASFGFVACSRIITRHLSKARTTGSVKGTLINQ